MAKRFSIEAVFKAVDKMSAPVSRMQNKIGKFTRKMDRGLRKVNKSVGRFAKKMKKGALIIGASLAIMGAGLVNVINVGADFGRAIGSAAAKFPEDIKRATQAFTELKEAARDVGRTTEFTATQAAQGLNFLAKAGFNAKFAVDSLKSFADFTTAAELEDFGRATDIATDVLGAFGLNAGTVEGKVKSLKRVMNVLTLTSVKSNTSVEEFFESVKLAGASAKSSGQSIETYSAIVGVLAGNTTKASMAGTSIRTIMLALIGVGQKSAATFKNLNIKMADNEGNIRNSISVLDELRNKLNKLSQIQRQRTIEAIFGKRALAAASILLSETGKGLKDFERSLLEAGGTTQRMAGFIRDDVRGSLDSLKSAIESVKLSIFDMNEGALKDTINRITDWIRANENLIASRVGEFLAMLIDNFDKILNTIHNIGRAMLIFGAFALTMKAFAASVGLVTFAMDTLAKKTMLAKIAMFLFNIVASANPIALIVIGIAALIAIIILLVKKWDVVKEFFVSLWDIIQSVIGGIGSVIGLAGKFLGFGDDDESEVTESGSPNIVSPQERAAKLTEEKRVTNTAEVTIKDDTGKAELTAGTLGNGLKLQPSGGFE